KLKAEFLQQYYESNGVPFRSRMIAHFTQLASLGSLMPSLYNAVVNHSIWGAAIRKMVGFAPKRSLPTLHTTTLRKWYHRWKKSKVATGKRKVYLFCDEFTNYNDTEIGITTIQLL